jgi:hypothetical protein
MGAMPISQPPAGTFNVGGVNLPLPRMDPWRALVISWDQDTPHNWPARVSPWEARTSALPLAAANVHNAWCLSCVDSGGVVRLSTRRMRAKLGRAMSRARKPRCGCSGRG